MNRLLRPLGAIDRFQRGHRPLAIPLAVVKKFGDDQANQYVVALGWYGFVSIYPLLLVVVTVFGFIGADSLGHGIVTTLHEFPVVGDQFNPARPSSSLHGSTIGLIVGLLVLLYGSQGVTQSAQGAMAQVWNVPHVKRPGFLPRLGRGLAALVVIGGTFVANAAAATYATASGRPAGFEVLIIGAMLVMNAVLFTVSFRILTPAEVAGRSLLPGAALSGVVFTLLITVGSGLIQHQVRNSSAVYGQFGVVIGLVGFLFILAKLALYCAELNPVLARRLWPRALVGDDPTAADEAVLEAVARTAASRDDQHIRVSFTPTGEDGGGGDPGDESGSNAAPE